MTLEQSIRAVQKKLGVEPDGNAGPQTWGAIYRVIVDEESVKEIKRMDGDTAVEGKKADSRSEGNIATLHPKVQPYARALIERVLAQGFIIKVISGTRSYEEQAELYRKYREGGPLAARPGRSNHNFRIAFDIGVFAGSSDPEKAKEYIGESPRYGAAGALGTSLGLTWGGNWRRQTDPPHFELRPAWAADLSESDMIDELSTRHDKGTDPNGIKLRRFWDEKEWLV